MPRPSTRVVLLASVLVGGGLGALHLPIARPLFGRMGVSCPVDSVSADQVESMHHAALATLRGAVRSPNLDVFGLTMIAARENDVEAWAATRQVVCKTTTRGLRYLSCANVPANAIGEPFSNGPIHDLTFTFDRSGALIGVDALRGGLTGANGAALGGAIAQRLRGVLGEPTETGGAFDVGFLEAGAFTTSYVKYRFADYLVTLTAVQMPGRGVTVREQYVGIDHSL